MWGLKQNPGYGKGIEPKASQSAGYAGKQRNWRKQNVVVNGFAMTKANMFCFPTQQIAVTGTTDVILSVDTIIARDTQATGRTVRNAGTPLKLRCMSIMGRMNSISKNWKTLPPTYLPNVQDAAQ